MSNQCPSRDSLKEAHTRKKINKWKNISPCPSLKISKLAQVVRLRGGRLPRCPPSRCCRRCPRAMVDWVNRHTIKRNYLSIHRSKVVLKMATNRPEKDQYYMFRTVIPLPRGGLRTVEEHPRRRRGASILMHRRHRQVQHPWGSPGRGQPVPKGRDHLRSRRPTSSCAKRSARTWWRISIGNCSPLASGPR